MKEFWNERYSKSAYAYGDAPNEYFKEKLALLTPGKILLPAEGEGRNAVYAAELGWDVYAFDISEAGKKKAEELAQKKGVSIHYQVGTLEEIDFGPIEFDAIGLIYAHFPPNIRATYHKLLQEKLKKGGAMIIEGFSKNNLHYREANPNVGGPQDEALLFSKTQMLADFQSFSDLELEEKETSLNEGLYHIGKASVIRFFGYKK